MSDEWPADGVCHSSVTTRIKTHDDGAFLGLDGDGPGEVAHCVWACAEVLTNFIKAQIPLLKMEYNWNNISFVFFLSRTKFEDVYRWTVFKV